MSWRDWFYFGPSGVAGPTTLYWRNAGTDWHTATNWSKTSGGPADGWVPRSIDSVVFDGNGNVACNLSANAVCVDFTISVGYAATFAIPTGSGYTLTIYGNFNQSSGTFSVFGNIVTIHGDFRRATSTMLGTGSLTTPTTFLVGFNKQYENTSATHPTAIEIVAGAQYHIFGNSTLGIRTSPTLFRVSGELILEAGSSAVKVNGILEVAASGVVSGSANFTISGGSVQVISGGYFAPVTLSLGQQLTTPYGFLGGGIFSCDISLKHNQTANRICAHQGTNTILGHFYIEVSNTGNVSWNNNTNNPSFEFRGDVSFIQLSTGAINYSKGTGLITLTGASDQSINFDNKILEDITVDKSGGTATFTDWLTTGNFTQTNGGVHFGTGSYVHTISGNALFNAGSLDCGNSVLAIAGNFDNRNLTTFSAGTGAIRMEGNDKTFYSISDSPTTRRYYYLDFPLGCYTRLKGTNTVRATNRIDISGRVHCEDVTLDAYNTTGVYFNATGRVSGGVFSITDAQTGYGIVQFPVGATIDCSYLTFNCGWGGICSFPPGTYAAGQVEIRDTSSNASPHSIQLQNGTYTFPGIFAFSMSNPNSTLTMQNDVNNPSFVFQSNVIFTQTSGALAWTRGTGSITFSGGNTQSVSVAGRSLEAVIINKTANTLTFNSNIGMFSFLHMDGLATFGTGFTFTIGNFTLGNNGTGTVTLQASCVFTILGNYSTLTSNATLSIAGSVLMNFTGSGKTFTFGSAGARYILASVDIQGSYTVTGTTNGYATTKTKISAGGTLTLQDSWWVAEKDLDIGGTVAGTSFNGRLYWYPTLSAHRCYFRSTGHLNNYSFYARPISSGIVPEMHFEFGTDLSCSYRFHFWTGSETFDRTMVFVGNPIFYCDIEMYMQTIANFTLDFLTNYCSVELKKSLYKNYVTTGRYFWNGYECIISGSGDQYFDGDGNSFGQMPIQKFGGGRVTFAPQGFTATDLGLLIGDVDFNGATVYVTAWFSVDGSSSRFWNGIDSDMSNATIHYANLYINGTPSNQLLITNIDFVNQLTSTQTVSYLTVTNSQRTGPGPDIDASDGTSVDGGGNLGWFFGILAIADHFHQIHGSLSYRYQILGPSQNIEELIGTSSRNKGLPGVNRHPYPLVGISNINILQNVD